MSHILRVIPKAFVVWCCAITPASPSDSSSAHVKTPDNIEANKKSGSLEDRTDSKYVLGPGDQMTIWALGVEEVFEKPFRVDPEGYVDLPLAGRIKAGGMQISEFRGTVADRLRSQVKEPQVSVSIVESKSQAVSVMGAVNTPGLQQLQGGKTLLEVLSMAGGLRTDAGYALDITRRLEYGRIPVDGAHDDATGRYSVARLNIGSFIDGRHPDRNILVRPNDVIMVPRADMVYVVGEVTKAGGFVLNEKEHISLLQALSLAGGMTQVAAPSYARVLRSTPGSPDRHDIPVNVSKLLKGKVPDMPLQPNDVLFIPNSQAKRVATKVAQTSLELLVGVVIWRH